jgi:ABC-type nickel/cobalt efflux system permease component RcnA
VIELCWVEERPHVESYMSAISKTLTARTLTIIIWTVGLLRCQLSISRLISGLTMWTEGVIVVLSLSAYIRTMCRSLHLMSIDSVSKEEVFNFLRNLLRQLYDLYQIL